MLGITWVRNRRTFCLKTLHKMTPFLPKVYSHWCRTTLHCLSTCHNSIYIYIEREMGSSFNLSVWGLLRLAQVIFMYVSFSQVSLNTYSRDLDLGRMLQSLWNAHTCMQAHTHTHGKLDSTSKWYSCMFMKLSHQLVKLTNNVSVTTKCPLYKVLQNAIHVTRIP